MRKRLSCTAAAGFAAVLSACAGGTVTGEYHTPFYTPELTAYTIRNGVMPTAVYGAPWPAAELSGLLAALELPAGHPNARFAMTQAAQEGDLGRVVLVFDPAPTAADGSDACRMMAGDDIPVSRDAGQTRVVVAFCYGNEVASESVARVPAASSATDQALISGLNGALARTLRTDDPNKTGGCGVPC